MKLYAVVDKDGVQLASIHESFIRQYERGDVVIKSIHTYDPDSQVVVDRDVYENILYAFSKTKRYVIQGDYDKFLSAGKEAT